MARVELFIDPLRISRQPVDIEVEESSMVPAVRGRIRAHLNASTPDIIRVRMDKQSFLLFKDLEGYADLQVMYVSAKGEFARKVNGTLPSWCTDKFIVDFGLLDKIFPSVQEFVTLSIDLKILYLIDPVLVTAASPEVLLYSLRNIPQPIQSLLASDEVRSHIESILAQKLGQAEVTIIFSALQVDNFSAQLDAIFREIVVEKIRAFVSRAGIAFATSPRQTPLSLTSKLTLTSAWWEVIDLEKVIISLTQRVIQSVEKGSLEADRIPEIIFGYNRVQLESIMLALENRPAFATELLLKTVRDFGRTDTLEIENAIQLQLQVAPPAQLGINSSAMDALDWAKEYLHYAGNAFRRHSEPEQSICESFSDWVVAQPTRLTNQQCNWRAVSVAVRAALKNEKLVVLLVVDALGAILSKALVHHLRGTDSSFHIEERLLFAPLPTITEIGKLAVAAGKDVFKLSGDHETAIASAYQDLLANPSEYQFLKGWTAGAKIMEPTTRLLFFFENQLDDKLHECLNYGDLTAQLQIVNLKIGKLVSQWMLEAESRAKDIEIFITADHGLTQIAKVEEFQAKKDFGSVGERYVKASNSKVPSPQNFYKISPEGGPDNCYYIPRNRVRLIKREQPFVHGGMTPEEVLIPLITIRPMQINESRPIRLQLARSLASLSGDGWSVQLVLICGVAALRSITIQAEAPFFGEHKFNSFSANEAAPFSLHLRSKVPQEGSVGVGFSIRFLMPGATTYTDINISLDVTLQPMVLIRGQGDIDFDNMFD